MHCRVRWVLQGKIKCSSFSNHRSEPGCSNQGPGKLWGRAAAARWAHNPKVGSSNLSPATTLIGKLANSNSINRRPGEKDRHLKALLIGWWKWKTWAKCEVQVWCLVHGDSHSVSASLGHVGNGRYARNPLSGARRKMYTTQVRFLLRSHNQSQEDWLE